MVDINSDLALVPTNLSATQSIWTLCTTGLQTPTGTLKTSKTLFRPSWPSCLFPVQRRPYVLMSGSLNLNSMMDADGLHLSYLTSTWTRSLFKTLKCCRFVNTCVRQAFSFCVKYLRQD